ncbi:MAG TPA: phosphatase PAP2 family protein, partial [Patescibacteria group bacterium]|nr:phosphatase PAP2 family protein [Patescibacteria group bacterium]
MAKMKHVVSFVIFTLQSRVIFILFLEIMGGILLSIISLFTFIDLAKDVFEKDVVFYDQLLSHLVYSFRHPALTKVMLFITELGSEYVLIVAALIGILLVWKKHQREATFLSLVLIMGFILNLLLKTLFQLPRPDIDPLILETSYSFPSGHAMNSFVFYAILAYFTYHFSRSTMLSITTGAFAVLLITLIGFSRIYLGVHYPSDVLAGFIAGFWWFITAVLLNKTI